MREVKQICFCHGFDFSSVMQKTRFFEKCGIIYVETEKTLRPLFQNFFQRNGIICRNKCRYTYGERRSFYRASFLYAPILSWERFWACHAETKLFEKMRHYIYRRQYIAACFAASKKYTPKGRKDEVYELHRKPTATNLTPRPAAPQVKQGHILLSIFQRKELINT